jgi:hypothetical protein
MISSGFLNDERSNYLYWFFKRLKPPNGWLSGRGQNLADNCFVCNRIARIRSNFKLITTPQFQENLILNGGDAHDIL